MEGPPDSFRVQVARLADALPIDEAADRRVGELLRAKRLAPKKLMPQLAADELAALRTVRDVVSDSDVLEWDSVDERNSALAVLDKLLTLKRGEGR